MVQAFGRRILTLEVLTSTRASYEGYVREKIGSFTVF